MRFSKFEVENSNDSKKFQKNQRLFHKKPKIREISEKSDKFQKIPKIKIFQKKFKIFDFRKSKIFDFRISEIFDFQKSEISGLCEK